MRKAAGQVGIPIWPMKYLSCHEGVIFDDGHEIDDMFPHARLNAVAFLVPGRSHLHAQEIKVINAITKEAATSSDVQALGPDQNWLNQFCVGPHTPP